MSQEELDPYEEAKRLRREHQSKLPISADENYSKPTEESINLNLAKTLKSGKRTMGCGLIFAFLPIPLAALATSPGSNMWSESDPKSGGAGLWALIVTLPIGFLIGMVGLIMVISASSKISKRKAANKK